MTTEDNLTPTTKKVIEVATKLSNYYQPGMTIEILYTYLRSLTSDNEIIIMALLLCLVGANK